MLNLIITRELMKEMDLASSTEVRETTEVAKRLPLLNEEGIHRLCQSVPYRTEGWDDFTSTATQGCRPTLGTTP